MKILIDAQSLQWAAKDRGIGKYTISFISSLVAHNLDVHVLINDGEHYDFAYNHCLKIVDHNNIHKFKLSDGIISRDQVIREVNPDIFHILDPLVPEIINAPFIDNKIKCVATIHDLIVFKFAKYRTNLSDKFVDAFIDKMSMLHLFDHIMVLTNHVKSDIINATNVQKDKISLCSSAMNIELIDETPSQLQLGKFILCVGGNDHRKNLSVLFDAYKSLPQKCKNEYSLVLVGPNPNYHVNGIIQFYATNSQLVSLYKSASLFVFPSLDEGFGMPLVEAMHFGCPLICSDTPPSHEIVGDIDCYFDPTSSKSIQKKILSNLYNNEKLANNKTYGLERAKLYNWDNVIKNVIDIYGKIL